MQFESKQKRTFWLNAALGFVPDVLVSVALAWAFNGGVVGFFAALIGLQGIYFLIWAKNSIWAWTLFKLHNRKYLVSHITDYLHKNKYPEPDDYEKSADGYLSTVMSDENQPTDVRLKAAASLAELNFMSTQGQIQNYMRFSLAYEEALENHKKTFTRTS